MTPVLFGVLMAVAGMVVAFVAFGLLAYFHEDTLDVEPIEPTGWFKGGPAITITPEVHGFRDKLMAELDALAEGYDAATMQRRADYRAEFDHDAVQLAADQSAGVIRDGLGGQS